MESMKFLKLNTYMIGLIIDKMYGEKTVEPIRNFIFRFIRNKSYIDLSD